MVWLQVHGLRGGSRKTWSYSEDPSLFWPKQWLPLEPRFRHVRLHTYGYNSDWAEKKGSVLNIHDFGSALLGDMKTSPYIQDGANVSDCWGLGDQSVLICCKNPIVFIGHSMGGLVIKKVVLSASSS